MSEMSRAERRALDQVQRAMRRPGDESEDLVEMVMMGYDLTVSNGQIAELVDDSWVSGSVATRSDGEAEPRFLSFEVAGLRFEFEIDGDSVLGTIDPPQAGRIVLQQPGPAGESAIGRSGSFEVTLVSDSTFRLVFEPEQGDSVATGWIMP